MEPSRPAALPGSTKTQPFFSISKALKRFALANWQPHPAGQPTKAPFDLSSEYGNKSGLFITSRAVFNSGCFFTVAGGNHQPSPKPVIGDLFATINLFSPTAFLSGTATAFAHSSGATSGAPFSFMEVKVGIVAPATNSTSQP